MSATKKPPQTSIDAFRLLKDGEVKQTYKDILWALSIIKKGTYEDIAKFLKAKPDKIWKRLSEIGGKKYDLIHRLPEVKKLSSGRVGTVWTLNEGTHVVEKQLPGKTISDHSRAISKITASVHEERII